MGGSGSSIGGGGADGTVIPSMSAGGKKIMEITSKKDLQSYMSAEYNIRMTDQLLRMVDLDTLKESMAGVADMLAEYSEVAEMLPEMQYSSRGSFIACFSYYALTNKGVGMNFSKHYKDRSTLMNMLKADADSHFHPSNCGVEATAVHETAHALERYIARKTGVLNKGVSERIVEQAYKNVYGSKPSVTIHAAAQSISGYAGSTKSNKLQTHETWAEAHADVYANKGKADPFSKEIVRLAREEYKKAVAL